MRLAGSAPRVSAAEGLQATTLPSGPATIRPSLMVRCHRAMLKLLADAQPLGVVFAPQRRAAQLAQVARQVEARPSPSGHARRRRGAARPASPPRTRGAAPHPLARARVAPPPARGDRRVGRVRRRRGLPSCCAKGSMSEGWFSSLHSRNWSSRSTTNHRSGTARSTRSAGPHRRGAARRAGGGSAEALPAMLRGRGRAAACPRTSSPRSARRGRRLRWAACPGRSGRCRAGCRCRGAG